MLRQLSPTSHSALTDAFTQLHDVSAEAEQLLAEAIEDHGSHKVAACAGLSHQTAIRWARGKISRLPAAVLQSLLSVPADAAILTPVHSPLPHPVAPPRSPEQSPQMLRQLSPGSHAALTDAFTQLHDVSAEAERLLTEAIDDHGSHKVAACAGLSHQTAIRWARGKISRLPAAVLDSLRSVSMP